MASSEWTKRGADAGFDEGVRVRGLADDTARRLALAGLEATVTKAARAVRDEGATGDEASWYAIGYRCGFDAAMRGRARFTIQVKTPTMARAN